MSTLLCGGSWVNTNRERRDMIKIYLYSTQKLTEVSLVYCHKAHEFSKSTTTTIRSYVQHCLSVVWICQNKMHKDNFAWEIVKL